MQSDADDVRIGTESDISYNYLTDGTGTFTGSPLKLKVGANTVACTAAGTATIRLPDGYTGTAATGTMTVDSSPVSLVAGANTITTSGGVGNITVTIVYVSYSSSTIGELANTAAYWYSDYITVPAYSNVSRDIWTGNGSALARDQWWISDDADTNTVADDASLDITTNLTLSAQVNLSALPATEKEIISKESNYELAVDNTNYIFRVWQVGAPTSVNLLPDGAGLTTTLTPVPAVANYLNVDDPVGVPDDVATKVYGNLAGNTDSYNIQNAVLPTASNITSVQVFARGMCETINCSFQPFLYLGGNYTLGTIRVTAVGTWTSYTETLARPGGGAWTSTDINNLQVGVNSNWDATGFLAYCTQIYVIVNYTPPDAGHVSQIAASTGETNITCTYDGANTSITDGTLTDTDALVGALLTNAEPLDIAIVDGKVDDVKIGDTAIAAPTWKLNLTFEASDIIGTGAATTVATHSGVVNMTSTRAGNPAGITVTVAGMLPTSPSSVPIVGTQALVTDAAKEWNPQDYTIPEVGSNLTNLEIPGLMVDTASRVSGVQTNWIWWFTYGIICICLFLVGMRFLGGHITISWIMVIVATACFVAWDVVPWWFILIYSIFALGSLAWENRTTI
jgi:hypothetical protein